MIKDIDIIGAITIATDESDPDNVVTETLAGWHVNLPASEMRPEWEPYRVEPATPSRVFWGTVTAFLRFADEAAARAVLGDEAFPTEPEGDE